MSKPEVIFTHESDLDGFVGGLLLQRLARKLFNTDIPLEAYHFDTWRQRPLKENCAWACDFTFDARMDKPGWLVVDHHPFAAPAKMAHLIHDPAKSASLLAYELCQQHGLGSPALDRLVHYSNVADMFLENHADFTLAYDYASLVKTYQFWNLHALIQGELEKLLDHALLEVMAVKRKIEDPLGLAWSKSHVLELSPTVAFVDTVIGNNNYIVHQLLTQQGSVPYTTLITLFRKGNGAIIASLRSRNGEAAKIAAILQGGGHPNAAGATLPRSVQRIPDALDYLKKVLNPAPVRTVPSANLESLFDT